MPSGASTRVTSGAERSSAMAIDAPRRASAVRGGTNAVEAGAALCTRRIVTHVTYVIDLTHYLDARGAIAPERGPARKLADFVTAVVVQASDLERADSVPGPLCFGRCTQDRPAVEAALTEDDPMIWRCTACRTEGQVSHWQGTFWDLS